MNSANGPAGAGSQFASRSGPGVSWRIQMSSEPSGLAVSPGVRSPIAYRASGLSAKKNCPSSVAS